MFDEQSSFQGPQGGVRLCDVIYLTSICNMAYMRNNYIVDFIQRLFIFSWL